MKEIEDLEEDITEETVGKSDGEEEVLSFVENDIILFKINSIVLKSLITKKVKKSLQKYNKNLKIIIKFESKETDYYLISICGENRNKVIESKMKLNQLISMTKRKRPFTHLITVPFNFDPLKQEFNRFKDNVLTNFKDYNGIDESLLQKPYKLHLTFCVLVLVNQNEIILAKNILKQSLDQIVRPIIEDKPLKISIEGLDVIKGQPNRAHVLYAQIKDDSNRFQSIADQIVGQFIKSGLLEDNCDDNRVKLHITFMNSLFRQRLFSNTYPKTSKKRIKRETFDAKAIIDSYNSHKFCETIVKSIQLNDIKTKSEDGFYGLIESIDLPKD